MELHVAFLPEESGALDNQAVVVIDVLRGTTSLLVLIERGCAEVVIAPTVEAARRYRLAHPDVLTAGEREGRPPAGFDFGNSPVAFAQAVLARRRVVFATTNGTRAVHRARSGAVVLLGCLRNCSAVAREALAAAAGGNLNITLVGAGREGRFSLDDAYTAGAIVDAILAGVGERGDVDLTDAALAARALYQATPDPAALFRRTQAGRHIIGLGLPGDIDYCAERDRSVTVPRVGDRVRVLAE